MSRKKAHKRPERDELETMIRLAGIKVASWRFCGSARCKNIIRKWCKEYSIPITSLKTRSIKPDCDTLLTYLNQEGQVRSTGECLSVTDETVRKWMRFYNIRRSYDKVSKSSRFKQFS